MDKKNIGRKSIALTEEQIEKVEELAAYLTCDQIAGYLGISKKTFYNLRNEDERVANAYNKGRATAITLVAKCLMDKIILGDIQATIFYLKTQAGWSEKQIVETQDLSVSQNRIINVNIRTPISENAEDRI